VCVRVVLVKSKLWGPKVPTKIVIPIIFDLVGTFFGPHEEKSLSSRMMFFESVKQQFSVMSMFRG